MRDDPIALLERELMGAARRRAVVVEDPAGSSHEPRGPWPSALRPARRRSSLGGFAAVVLSGLAVIVALGALVSLHGGKSPARSAPARPAAIPGRQQLIDILGVLRRPQTKADLDPRILSQLSNPPPIALRGAPDLPLVRLASTTPWGEKFYLVPYLPPTAAQVAAVARRFPGLPSHLIRGETLDLLSAGGGGGGGDATGVEAGQAMEIDGAGRSFAGGSTQTRYILVVPDGVARVEFYFPPQGIPGGGPTYHRSLAVTVPVHGNIAAVQVARQMGAPPALIWYGSGGRVIKQIGSMKPPPPTPQQGPETALSRAAERDPSTPNRVWVTPAVGGPHTVFKFHFLVLLTDADYSYQLSGTKCPAITVNGGSGGGTNDLRGRIWTDVVDGVAGQSWCPGTYHLSATIMDLGRAGSLKHPAKPFGTAAFTVKP
ncbi:MAG: hypothetical protein JO027_21320 [Solirubrobacterales bacterium]|nr:hypothetical protein [Solirubrobacterales bacterium]